MHLTLAQMFFYTDSRTRGWLGFSRTGGFQTSHKVINTELQIGLPGASGSDRDFRESKSKEVDNRSLPLLFYLGQAEEQLNSGNRAQ